MFAASVLGMALVIGLLPQEPPSKPKITAQFLETPAPGPKPGLRCQGTSSLPDDSRLDLTLYFEKVIDEQIVARAAVPVKGGKFTHDFFIFAEKNLSGPYHVRVSFQPSLQAADRQKLPAVELETAFQVGDAADAKRDRAAFKARLSDEVRAIKAMSNEVLAEYQKHKGTLDKNGWKRLSDGWRDRCLAIEKRAHDQMEYRVLGLYEIVNSGLEHLRALLLSLALAAARGDEVPMAEARIRLDQVVENQLAELAPPPPDLSRMLREQGETVARIVKGLPAMKDPEEVLRARRGFLGALLVLGRHAPEAFQEAIRAIVGEGLSLFEALEYRTDEEKEIHPRLESKVKALQEGLKNLKDEEK